MVKLKSGDILKPSKLGIFMPLGVFSASFYGL